MTKRIALIPVDARPVTYDLPKDLAKFAGWEVLLPPKADLGFLKEPADLEKLNRWIDEVLPEVEGFVVSVDMLLYGGLVPSRVNTDEEKILHARLEKLREVKKLYPDVKIMAFSSTMRLSNSYVNQEEKDYWDQYGKEIWQYSYHAHRFEKHGEQADQAIIEKMKKAIPSAILEDYLATRKKNFSINLSLINEVEQGLVDLLIFPQDDTSEYGLNIKEQEELVAQTTERGLLDSIYVYPGADEVSSMLVARMIFALEAEEVPTFYPVFSGLKGALSTAMYEDRTIQESVKGQIYAFGSHTVETPGEADIILGVNVPGQKQGDMALQLYLDGVNTNDRNIGEWTRKLRYYHKKEKRIAIADVAYANGADPVMIAHLLGEFDLQELDGFAAWNTAGNTLGTVVAQAALLFLAEKKGLDVQKEKIRQFGIRYLDDYIYQSIVRKKIREEIGNEEEYDGLLAEVTKVFLKEAEEAMKKQGIPGEITNVYLPWNRTFEIGVELEG
ncbi:DUF4127 family protein [Ornithinibacillus halotolerans]|uniref:DUF4127 family protein n=1 Tax=Ornithinibacillus halotolerans TaxID=1274357 RepID=A0A916S180_9BACI|nr:DUF4127 family protein [Ornithinibacillus halotolerans]GGA79500.1 hypothetical protein GCM10008025_23630 [Ornithinibacillus halotolerans]